MTESATGKRSPKWMAIPVIILLSVALVFAARYGISNVYFFQAERELIRWGKGSNLPELQQLTAAEQRLNRALQYWPHNPDYLVLRAQVFGWQSFMLDNTQGYQKGLQDLRNAIHLRPAHAYTWVLLAEFKSALNEKDKEWQVAREKALQFGGGDQAIVERIDKLIEP